MAHSDQQMRWQRALARGSSRTNGIEAWRLRDGEFAGISSLEDAAAAGPRTVQMLRVITHPAAQWVAGAVGGIPWMDPWQHGCRLSKITVLWEGGEGSTGEDVLVATLLGATPEPFREVIKRMAPQRRQSVGQIRKALGDYYACGTKLAILHEADGATGVLAHGQEAMKVDKVKGKKGKGGGSERRQ